MFKAQGILELGLIFAVVVLIAVVAFTPIGTKVKNALDNMAPQKTVTADSSTLDKITGSTANTTTLTSNLDKLQNSSNTSSKEAASFVKDVLEIASTVSTGQNNNLSNDDVEKIATSMKKTGMAETSGSLASIIAVNVDDAALAASDKTTLSEIESALSDSKISVNTASDNLASSINALVSLLSTTQSSSDLSTVNSNTTVGIINGVLVAVDVVDSSSATAEMKTAAQAVIDAFKTALDV